MDSHGQSHATCPMVQWTGQTVGQAWSEGGMSSGHPMDIHWTGRTIPSGQRILMANLDMSVFLQELGGNMQDCYIGLDIVLS